jgi:hypothetical protein
LSREMILAGERLARYLNERDLEIDGLLWLYLPELNGWRFVIATPEVKTNGPKNVYQKVRALIADLPPEEEQVDSDDIMVLDSSDSLIQLLRVAIRTGAGLSGIRFSRNVINGVLIEDAYIYKLV